ncbi:MAG: sodium:proton antiporter [Armatimonadetes bacterium]|nr:sodium:proton antiporter [Armatimonadota bacterium]
MENTGLNPEEVLIQLAMVVVVGIAAQWLAWRVRLPAIVLLLTAGIVMGPVMGFLNPDEILGEAVLPIVSMSVAIILFEGGMSLKISELRGTGRVVTMLVTLGAAMTWLLSGTLAVWLLGLNLETGILLGAILMVTGPTVIGPLLRHVRPIGKSGTILKWEGLTIDPIGAIAAVLTFEFLFVDSTANHASEAFVALFATFGVGVLVGLLAAGAAVLLLKKFWIPDFLVNPASVAFVLLAYVASNQAQPESGLVAVTVMGFALANQRWVRVGHILEFKENLRVLLISSLFVLLAARLSPNILSDIHWQHAVFVVGLIVIVRPASVLLSTLGSNLSIQERAFICCMAPRGIVAAAIASIFALRLGGPQGDLIMTTTFLVVISSVVVYGFAALPVAVVTEGRQLVVDSFQVAAGDVVQKQFRFSAGITLTKQAVFDGGPVLVQPIEIGIQGRTTHFARSRGCGNSPAGKSVSGISVTSLGDQRLSWGIKDGQANSRQKEIDASGAAAVGGDGGRGTAPGVRRGGLPELGNPVCRD